jgi:hypothetical protein
VLLARSRVYGPFRIGGAALTGIAAAAWFAERGFGWDNPIGPVVEGVASHALWLLAGLVVLSIASTVAASEKNPRAQNLRGPSGLRPTLEDVRPV